MEPRGDRYQLGTRVLKWCLGTIVALVALKFLALLAEYDWDVAQAPWGLLIVVVVSAVLLVSVLARYPKAGAVVMAALMVLFIAVVALAFARDGFARESWADYPLAYGGLILAAVGLYWAVRLLRETPRETVRRRVDTGA